MNKELNTVDGSLAPYHVFTVDVQLEIFCLAESPEIATQIAATVLKKSMREVVSTLLTEDSPLIYHKLWNQTQRGYLAPKDFHTPLSNKITPTDKDIVNAPFILYQTRKEKISLL